MSQYLISLSLVNALVATFVFVFFYYLHREIYKYLFGFMLLAPQLFVSLGILKLILAAIDTSIMVSSESYILGASLLISCGLAMHFARTAREPLRKIITSINH